MNFELINELVGLIVPLLLGLFVFRYMGFIYRLFFFQLFFSVIIYILSWVLPSAKVSDHWLYNLSMPVETGLLVWAGYLYFISEKRRYLIWLGFTFFMIIYISDVLIKGISIFFNYGYIAESTLLVIIYLLILYSHFIKQSLGWKTSPEIWISIGIVLYFGGVVPYLSLMRYLQSTHPQMSSLLYSFIIEGLETVRYLFLAIGFWLIRRNALQKVILSNE